MRMGLAETKERKHASKKKTFGTAKRNLRKIAKQNCKWHI
jgi:hypothetical protein